MSGQTKAMLEADNHYLRNCVRKNEEVIANLQREVALLRIFPNHIATMTIGCERLSEALSRTVKTLNERR
jgi:hypothetical protein